ncbi:MAG: alpha-ketoacid dehydrogenase subunit alpha/beta [Thermoguttaceae bacterium]
MPLETREVKNSMSGTLFDLAGEKPGWIENFLARLQLRKSESTPAEEQGLGRFPQRLSQESFYGVAYPIMYLGRRLEDRMEELFQKGYAKGTVTSSIGNEATAVGFALPLRPGGDVVSVLHRDIIAHLLLGASPYQLFCQYMANDQSPTHAREGNAHHGNASKRRLPMISHLGKMLSLVVGGTWAARRAGEEVFGLAVIGDGGTSTGEFHEALNIASVRKSPVLFLIENNYYAFSTPISAQYRCEALSDRARGYGISGRTIDGTDAWGVYNAVCDAFDAMRADSLPYLLECMTLRIKGHAAYDKCEYISSEEKEKFHSSDPMPSAREKFREMCGYSAAELASLENQVDVELQAQLRAALSRGRPEVKTQSLSIYAPAAALEVEPYHAEKVKNGEAVNRALDYLLERHQQAFLMGLDIGRYGSAFKTCKGLIDRFGPERVIDMPLCESGLVGFALGASQVGSQPIMEYQFADFSTESVTQLGLNAGTWYFRSGSPAPILLRLPCGGGLTMGAFHSGEFEGLWSRFPGLKLLYPATAQETFEALLAGFYDPNPCLVLEHKLLYWTKSGPIDFDGKLSPIWRARRYSEGDNLTIVAFGAMVYEALAAVAKTERSIEVWNPFVLHPISLDPIVESVRKTGRLLVVQECSMTQGLGEMVISRVARAAFSSLKTVPRLLAAPDLPVPFAPELESQYRSDAQKILAVVEEMLN